MSLQEEPTQGIKLAKKPNEVHPACEVDQLQQPEQDNVVHLIGQLKHVLSKDDQRGSDSIKKLLYRCKIPPRFLFYLGYHVHNLDIVQPYLSNQ